MSLLAASGFRVLIADAQLGLITAIRTSQERVSIGIGRLSRNSDVSVVTVFVEERVLRKTTVRTVFAKSGVSPMMIRETSAEHAVTDPDTYFKFY